MTAQEIAEKHPGKVARCIISKSKPPANVKWVATSSGQAYEVKIIGWKTDPDSKDGFVIVEVLPPATTNFMVRDMKGVKFTHKVEYGKYAKRIYPDEIVEIVEGSSAPPTKWTPKTIPPWPHTCRDCKSPALLLGTMIDCSNAKCVHKFKSKDAKDLFMPPNLRNADADVKFDGHGPEIDDDGHIVCSNCKGIAVDGKSTKGAGGSVAGKPFTNPYTMKCDKGHTWAHDAKKGHKIKTATRILVFDGKTFVVKKA